MVVYEGIKNSADFYEYISAIISADICTFSNSDKEDSKYIEGNNIKIKYIPYTWNLNKQ